MVLWEMYSISAMFVNLVQNLVWAIVSSIGKAPLFFWIIVAFAVFPGAAATPGEAPFPDISFHTFSTFIKDHFS
jgi:hypothetical protein